METAAEKGLRRSFIASDGAEISYLDIGEGTPLLWIHGWGGDAARQQDFLSALSRFGFRGLCFDQRGCGESKSVQDLGIPRSARDTTHFAPSSFKRHAVSSESWKLLPIVTIQTS